MKSKENNPKNHNKEEAREVGETKLDKYISWTAENSKNLPFEDLLISNHELAVLLNKGARDRNKSSALKYIEVIRSMKNLDGALGSSFNITFGEKETRPENWDMEVLTQEEVDKESESKIKDLFKIDF